MKHKYYTINEDNDLEQIPGNIADDVIRQYIERRYTGALLISMFVIGFLCGVIAYAL